MKNRKRSRLRDRPPPLIPLTDVMYALNGMGYSQSRTPNRLRVIVTGIIVVVLAIGGHHWAAAAAALAGTVLIGTIDG